MTEKIHALSKVELAKKKKLKTKLKNSQLRRKNTVYCISSQILPCYIAQM